MQRSLKRRQWLQAVGAWSGLGAIHGLLPNLPEHQPSGVRATSGAPPRCQDTLTPISDRLELFVDNALIESSIDCRRVLHQPERREIVFQTDAPWEGNGSGYQSIVRDGERWLLYYRGGHHPASPAYAEEPRSWETLCVAVSQDGLHWTRPSLGMIEYSGNKRNNIILDQSSVSDFGGSPAHTAVFLDQNPRCPANERFKLVIRGRRPKGLYLMTSADGVQFNLKSTTPFTTQGAFDSQNVMFWDPSIKKYREYHRGFQGRRRGILTAISDDPTKFPNPEWLQFPESAAHALYTNQVQPYYRAPHVLIGFPMRYVDRGLVPSVDRLPNPDGRSFRMAKSQRYGTALTDTLFMSSRNGVQFDLWEEAYLRPGPARQDTWVYGDNFVFWGMVETASHLPQAPPEISLYATEGYWEGEHTSVRRYTTRLDGFVSLNAPFSGGEVLTKPLTFSGRHLALNVATSAAGAVQVGLESPNGTPIPGYSVDDCDAVFGDGIQEPVSWKGRQDLGKLMETPLRLRFRVHDADLFAFQFRNRD